MLRIASKGDGRPCVGIQVTQWLISFTDNSGKSQFVVEVIRVHSYSQFTSIKGQQHYYM
jgi:phage-related protein